MTPRQKKMIEEFQCPGCVNGSNTEDCERFELHEEPDPEWPLFACDNHCMGTRIMPLRAGLIALGLPKGFCRFNRNREKHEGAAIRLWAAGTAPTWNRTNVAVWAMEKDGFLFVRTYAPRVDYTCIDVIDRGTLTLVPNAINVEEFIDEID